MTHARIRYRHDKQGYAKTKTKRTESGEQLIPAERGKRVSMSWVIQWRPTARARLRAVCCHNALMRHRHIHASDLLTTLQPRRHSQIRTTLMLHVVVQKVKLIMLTTKGQEPWRFRELGYRIICHKLKGTSLYALVQPDHH